MWISQKKYNLMVHKVTQDERLKAIESQQEMDLWHRIIKLERQVKKLKKQIREGV